MKKILILIICSTFLNITVSSQTSKIQDTIVQTEFVGGQKLTTYTIIPDTNYVVLFPDPINSIDLSMEELQEVKKILKECIRENTVLYELSRYKRQYIAQKNMDGEKIVNVYCHCSYYEKWKKEIIYIEAGGKCFFNVFVNLKTKRYSQLHVNRDF